MPLVLPPFTLQGRSVVLRPLEESHASALAAASAESREHYRFTHVPKGLDCALEYIRRALGASERGERIPFAIVYEGRVVGTTSYSDFQPWTWPDGSPLQRNSPDAVEIGSTWLAQSAQRTGCNSEAKYLLLSHAFDVWAVHRVALQTDERNERSRRAIERLGARLDGIRRAHTAGADGSVRNSACYSLLRDEWPQTRRQLEQRLESR
jgi:N-acetyltransferase